MTDFLRRTGRRSGTGSRRGACRVCRKQRTRAAGTIKLHAADMNLPEAGNQAELQAQPLPLPVTENASTGTASQPAVVPEAERLAPAPPVVEVAPAAVATPKRPRPTKSSARTGGGKHRPRPLPVNYSPSDVSLLRTTRNGTVWMRGKTDKGRRWHQEIDLELAVTLVKERAAVIVNRTTIRRLFSNKDFRSYILTRDNYVCHFCGQYGDTIDHMLPRAKGGHTTPDNCVVACNECNQSKADKDIEEFMREL
ncbi:HNH endonuclease [Paenibacillus glycanilyticus]|uniref:HNH nuclease domain-containing protein n=1 Tax=Paenibacillus glycanilyticus TaxID=126569 RepID=A0ABQ6G7Z0_9BACL|nr:HNH endonuclease [Paenibacillus glycanilyticus]GLX65807.1 hypothetical protein MU1_01510 [Paenibacillus glycanilyticus]